MLFNVFCIGFVSRLDNKYKVIKDVSRSIFEVFVICFDLELSCVKSRKYNCCKIVFEVSVLICVMCVVC